jgi:hypothetical protein
MPDLEIQIHTRVANGDERTVISYRAKLTRRRPTFGGFIYEGGTPWFNSKFER